MEAKESKIIDILTENKKYIVPSYQRPYSWDGENAERLIDDIYNSFHQKDDEYFIGTLICINKGNYTYEIVDGQQRLTTLSLIFAKIKDLIVVNKRAKENLQKRVLPIDDFSDKPQEPRLRVRPKDYDVYCNYILQGNKKFLPNSPTSTQNLFIENFQIIGGYLSSKIGDDEGALCALAKYILENVYVVFVETNTFNSSFRLFNVLNTRGMPLASSDLIKNTLFEIAEESGDGHEMLEKYWNDIEDTVGTENMNKFLMANRLSQKKDRDRAVKGLVEEYSELLKSQYSNKPYDLVIDILESAKNYSRIIENDFKDISIINSIESLSKLSDEWVPPILAFLNKMSVKGNDDSANLKKFIEVFEKCYMHFWFRRQVRSRREIICFSTSAAINQNKSFDEVLANILEYADNDSVVNYFDGGLYDPSPVRINFLKMILLRLDRAMQDESVVKSYHGRITIEHVLPQKMSNDYWQKRFTQDDHGIWVHRLGNLALISGSRNSEAQNSSFDKKKEVYKKMGKKVSFDITKNLLEFDDWNVDSVRARHKFLVQMAVEIWSL